MFDFSHTTSSTHFTIVGMLSTLLMRIGMRIYDPLIWGRLLWIERSDNVGHWQLSAPLFIRNDLYLSQYVFFLFLTRTKSKSVGLSAMLWWCILHINRSHEIMVVEGLSIHFQRCCPPTWMWLYWCRHTLSPLILPEIIWKPWLSWWWVW